MTPKRVVVTGGCGFLGQYVTAGLQQALPEASISVLDLRPNPFSVFDWSSYSNVELQLGVNICNYPEIESLFLGADLVVHAAGIVAFSLADRDRLFHVHEHGTANVFRASAESNIKRLVHVSSVAALGFGAHRNDQVDEQYDFDWSIAERKRKYYMLSKRRADLIAHKYRADGLDVRIAYPSLMYGPGDASNSIHVIRAIGRNKIPFTMPGGNAVSDVRDVAEGIVKMCLGGPEGEDFILAAHNFTSEELFGHVSHVLRVDPPSRKMSPLFGPVLFKAFLLTELIVRKGITLSADSIDSAFRYRFFDSSKARRELSWKPRAFEQTLNDATTWLRTNDLIE